MPSFMAGRKLRPLGTGVEGQDINNMSATPSGMAADHDFLSADGRNHVSGEKIAVCENAVVNVGQHEFNSVFISAMISIIICASETMVVMELTQAGLSVLIYGSSNGDP